MAVPWLMWRLEMLCCAGASPGSDGVGGCQHLSLCKCCGSKKENRSETKLSGAGGRKSSNFSSSPDPLFTVKYTPKCP